jgi:hypothetical protein
MPNIDVLNKKCKRAAEKLGLTLEQVSALQNCALSIYEEVSFDLEPDCKKRGTCRRSTILEVVCDAGRLEQEVCRCEGLPLLEKSGTSRDSHPLVKACRNYSLILDLIGPAFSYSEYEAGPC